MTKGSYNFYTNRTRCLISVVIVESVLHLSSLFTYIGENVNSVFDLPCLRIEFLFSC